MPWAVGAGAQLDASVARTFTNIATQDAEGINLPGDFKVTAGPGRAVTIAAGGMTIRNRQRGGEAYIGAATATTTVPVPQNTSGATRRDMIIARVIDPDFSPWQPYTNTTQILSGPYFEPFVVTGVSSTARTLADVGITYSAVPLARTAITSGATTNPTVEADLRALARPRFWFDEDIQNGFNGDEDILVSETTWHNWPLNTYQIYVPTWATEASVTIALNNVLVDKVAADFQSRVNFGGVTKQSANFDYNGSDWSPVGYVETRPHTIYAEFNATELAGLRGTTVTVRPQVQRWFTQNTGRIWFRPTEQISFDVRFREALT